MEFTIKPVESWYFRYNYWIFIRKHQIWGTEGPSNTHDSLWCESENNSDFVGSMTLWFQTDSCRFLVCLPSMIPPIWPKCRSSVVPMNGTMPEMFPCHSQARGWGFQTVVHGHSTRCNEYLGRLNLSTAYMVDNGAQWYCRPISWNLWTSLIDIHCSGIVESIVHKFWLEEIISHIPVETLLSLMLSSETFLPS